MSEKNTQHYEQARAFNELFDETVALFHRLRWAAEHVHEPGASGHGRGRFHHGGRGRGRGFGWRHGRGFGRGRGQALTAARRGILRSLREEGTQTVPDLARSRKVSRQHIQSVVNELEELGLVQLVENPSHKRSRLVELTERGREALEVMLEREMEYLGTLDAPVAPEDLRSAAATLRKVRESLQLSPALREDEELETEQES